MRIPSAFPARPLFAAALCALCSSGLRAQEFSLLAGPLVSKDEDTYSWQATYREGLGRHAAWSFSWLNEGHIPNHHRDGQLAQLWGRLPLSENRLERGKTFGDPVTRTFMPSSRGNLRSRAIMKQPSTLFSSFKSKKANLPWLTLKPDTSPSTTTWGYAKLRVSLMMVMKSVTLITCGLMQALYTCA